MYKKLKEEKVYLDFIKLTDYSNFNFEHIGKYIENVIPKKYDLFDYKQAKQAVLDVINKFEIFRPILEMYNKGILDWSPIYTNSVKFVTRPDGTFDHTIAPLYKPGFIIKEYKYAYDDRPREIRVLDLCILINRHYTSIQKIKLFKHPEVLSMLYDELLHYNIIKFEHYKNSEYIAEKERLYNLHKQRYTLKKLIICDILRKTAN